MLKGNKGEWGELYAFSYLLASGKLYSADKDLNAMESIYFPILKIIREETKGEIFNYYTGDMIKIFLGDKFVKELNKEDFEHIVSVLKEKIPDGTRAFEIEEVNEFFESIYCFKLKAASNQKQDITVQIHDINTGISPICGFSIKSYLGSNPTLINPGVNTNFVFKITNCDDNIMDNVNNITTRTKIIDKMKYLNENNCDFIVSEYLESKQFEENLCFIDTIMPKFISFAILS